MDDAICTVQRNDERFYLMHVMVIEEILIKMETHESIPFSSTENALQVLCFKKLIPQAGPSKKNRLMLILHIPSIKNNN